MDLDENDVLLTDQLEVVHLDLGERAELRPQNDFDRVEKPLRDALSSGKIKSFMLNKHRDRTEIPKEHWSIQEFWELAHVGSITADGRQWIIVLDGQDLAAAHLRREIPVANEWLDNAPEAIKALALFDYMKLVTQFLPLIQDGRDVTKKGMLRLMDEKKFERWSEINQNTFFLVAKRPTTRAAIAREARKRLDARRARDSAKSASKRKPGK